MPSWDTYRGFYIEMFVDAVMVTPLHEVLLSLIAIYAISGDVIYDQCLLVLSVAMTNCLVCTTAVDEQFSSTDVSISSFHLSV